MQSYDFWEKKISQEAKKLNFSEGYKILYCPWSTIGRSSTVFLSLNPGKPPYDADLYTLSDERGNSYEVEQEYTRSPITAQFLALAELMDLQPKEILTGVTVPFRSNRWKDIPLAQRRSALQVGKAFWNDAFTTHQPKIVICCCPEAAQMANEIFGARLEMTLNSGWGNISLYRFRAKNGTLVVQIPHLSTFKLLSRQSCIEPLKSALGLQA